MLTIVLIVFAFCVIIGVPMAFGLGLASITYIMGEGVNLAILAQRMFTALDKYSFMAIPMFVLAGDLMNNGGITKRILKLSTSLVGHLPGSLAQVSVVAGTLFAAMSGSALASCSCIGTMVIPEMKKKGYDPGFACAIVAASAILGPIIPPSSSFVHYGSVTGTSVAGLLMGGVLPGLMLAGIYMLFAFIYAKVNKLPVMPKASWGERGRALVEAIPALITPGIIIGGIMGGIFTATEAGAVAALYAMVLGFITKELTIKGLISALYKTAKVGAAIMMVTATALAFSWMLTAEQVPQMLSAAATSICGSPFAFLCMTVLILMVNGCFIMETATIPMLAPLLAPIATQFGINPIHFGVVFVAMLGVGALTPPVGSLVFVAARVGETPLGAIFKNAVPFIVATLLGVLIMMLVPGLSTWLPSLLA